MPVTRIKNNQITDASGANTQLGVNAAVKLQNYTVTATKIANNLVYGSDLTVTGNLTVQGNTTTIDTTITTIEDPVIVLASTQTSGAPVVDIGFLGYRGNQSNIAFVWDESATEFVTAFTSTGETNTTITITSYANFHTNDANISGNLVVGGNISITGNVASLNVTGNITGGNLLTPGQVSAAGNVTGGNVNTAGLVTATGNVTGGNLLTGGLISATSTITSAANITGGNLLTGGLISATATITGGNLATGGTVSATGNVTGGNVLTGGLISATSTITSAANITGGNLLTGGLISATSTITSAANITGGNILTGGLISATSNITGGNILFGSGIVTGTGNIYGGNIISGNAVIGNINVSGDITVNSLRSNTIVSAGGNVIGGNISTAGLVTATGNVTGGNLLTGGLISATSTITSAANITGANLITGGLVTATGNVTGGNINTAGLITATGNVTGGNLITGGLITATGNVTTAGALNGATLSLSGNVTSPLNVTGNIAGGNISTPGLITAAGNVTGGNVNTGGLITAAGNVTGGNLLTGGQVSAVGNVSANNVNTDTVYSSSGLTLTAASGDLVLNPSGNIDAQNNYINNLADPVLSTDAATKEYVDNAVSSGIHIHTPVYVETPVALPSATYAQGGNTFTVNQTIAGNTVVFSTTANLQPNDQLWFSNSFEGIVANTAYFVVSAPNTSAAVLSTSYNGVPVTTITSNTGLTQSVRVNSGVGATLTATANGALTIDSVSVTTTQRVLVYQQANAVQNGVYVVSDAGNVSAPWILTRATDSDQYVPDTNDGIDQGSYFYVQAGATGAGESYVLTQPVGPFIVGYANIEFTQFSASQVYTANTNAGLNLTGTVFSAKVDNNTTAFDGGGNIIVKAGANLTTPNIGAATGTSLSLTGNVTSGNVNTAGLVTATGNVTGGNINTAGSVTATGNITTAGALNGATLSLSGNVTSALNVTGNIAGGNISTPGLVTATGNVTGGNILTAGIMSSTGNAIHGNVLTGGVVSATSNITGGNILTGGLISATSTITSAANITGGNLLTGGLISATSTITSAANITGGNILTGGLISATSTITSAANITGGNLLTGGLISATSNITGGNLLFGSGIVSGTGNIYANNIFANISGNIDAGGSNTNIQFNDNDLLAGSPGFTFDKTSNAVVANGNITGSNFITAGVVTATGNVTGGNILTGGLISATSTITSAANITGANITTGGLVTATGNVTGGNVLTGGLVSATANVTGGNINTAGLITATGNITGANLILTTGIVDGPAAGRITINGSDIDTDFAVDGDTLANVFYVDAGTGTASFGSSTQVTNAIVNFSTTNSIKVPVGNTTQRPATGVTGMIRFNTTNNNIEVYDNTQWVAVGVPVFTVIADEQFAGDGANTVFTLTNGNQTTNSCIVSINGVVQIPTLAYAVSGAGGNVLTFTEAPASGDVIDVRQITTTTSVTSISNSSGNAVIAVTDAGAHINITGDLIPTTANTYTLGNASNRWANLFVSGNSIYLGNLILKENPANTFVVYLADGITQANIDVGNVDVSAITSGTSAIGIYGTGQAYVTVNGNSNVLLASNNSVAVTGLLSATGNVVGGNIRTSGVVSATANVYAGEFVFGNIITAVSGEFGIPSGCTVVSLSNAAAQTVWIAATNGTSINIGNATSTTTMGGNIVAGGFVSATGNVIGGNIRTAGAITATGNITGNFIFGNGSQLTGIDATSIQSGTSNVRVVSSGGNVTTGVGGTANVVVVASTGQFVTGVSSVSGNVTGGNILTAGLISATGNITGGFFIGNGSQLTGIDATAIQNGTANVRTFLNGNVTTSAAGTANVVVVTSTGSITTGTNSTTGNVIGGNILTAGLISATGNITGGNITINGNATITGNLSVSGTETIFNVANLTVNDKDIIVANNVTGGANVNGAGLQAGNPATATWFFNNATTSWQSNIGITPTTNGTLALGGASNYWGNAFVTNISLTGNIVDSGALTISTGSNGNIALAPNGTGIVTVGSALSATGNIAGSFFIGNGSQLTGIDATAIQNGTANVRTFLNGNVTTSAAGTANVVVVTSTGTIITGTESVTGNITGGNLLTAGLISATGAITGAALTGTSLTVSTGNITGGNLLLSGAIIDSAQLDIQTSASNANIALAPNGTGFVTVSTQLSAVGNVTGGNIRTAGLISATGAITGAAITGTSLTVSTGNITCGNIVNANGNGVGNIGSSTTYFNTVFAKATSAQYADLAEKYSADADYEPGTVVMFGGAQEVTICSTDACRRIAGVISTNPSYRMNDGLISEHTAMVALTGRVPTRVTGTVRKGDLMVSAGNGRARAEADPKIGTVIGKALADFDGTEGVIEVVVGRL